MRKFLKISIMMVVIFGLFYFNWDRIFIVDLPKISESIKSIYNPFSSWIGEDLKLNLPFTIGGFLLALGLFRLFRKHRLEKHKERECESNALQVQNEDTNQPDDAQAAQTMNRSAILLVEGNQSLVRFIKGRFKDQFDIYIADSEQTALNMAANLLPDIIIGDVLSPDSPGEELYALLKTNKATKNIPIVMLRSKPENPEIPCGHASYADAFLTVPFHFELLRELVQGLIVSPPIVVAEKKNQLPYSFTYNNMRQRDQIFLEKFSKLIENAMSDPDLKVNFLLKEMGMSHSVLYRRVQMLTGMTLSDYIRNSRLRKAGKLLRGDNISISEVSDQVGFSNPKYFSSCFKEMYSVTPSTYQKNHQLTSHVGEIKVSQYAAFSTLMNNYTFLTNN